MRPGSLVDPGPQRSDRSLRRSAGDKLPTLAVPVLAGSAGEVVDSSSLRFLTAALRQRKEEEVKREAKAQEKKVAESEVQQQAEQEKEEEEEEEADASYLLSLSSRPRSSSTAAVAWSQCWFSWSSSSRFVPFGFWQARDALHHGRNGPEGLLHVRRHPFRAADADPQGPDYSADHRVSPVAVRFRWSMPLLCWSCLPCRARDDNGSLRPRLVYDAPRLCSSSLLQAKIFGILADMDQEDSCSDIYYAGFAGDKAPRAVFLAWQAHDVPHHGRYGPDGQLRHGAHVQTAENCGVTAVAVRPGRRHLFRSAEADLHGPGYSADHRDSPVAVRFPVVDALCCAGRAGSLPRRGAEASSIVHTVRLTMDIPQLLNTVADVPVVRSHSSRVQTWKRQLSSHSCSSSFCVDTVVHIPVVVQRQMPGGSDVTVAVMSRSWSAHGGDELMG